MTVPPSQPGVGSSASLLVGVTGKLDLHGAEDAVREAIDRAFARLDARCPATPKLLLTGLARGADTVAAEAALARPGWEVVGVLPFAEALFLEDFDDASKARYLALTNDPRVKRRELAPLRRTRRGDPLPPAELSRAAAGPNPARADHYEQVGLFISERAAVLLAVMDADEQPEKIGGTARIVRHRLGEELRPPAQDIVCRSSDLVEPPRLVDPHRGAVWLVDLGALAAAPAAPGASLGVWTPGATRPTPLGDDRASRESLALADSLERLNQQIGALGEAYWRGLDADPRVGPHKGDACSELRRLRKAISDIQITLMDKVRRSILWLAVISCVAILVFEAYVDWKFLPWSRWFAVAYPAVVLAAIGLYWRAARRRWQPLGEDYRAVSETLRVQLAWWESGLTAPRERVERHYLRGADGALAQLRALINAVIEGALLRWLPPPSANRAAEAWAEGQLQFFGKHIKTRRSERALVETGTWFVFAASLSVAICLAATTLLPANEAWLAAAKRDPAWLRGVLVAIPAAAAVALFAVSYLARRRADDGGHAPRGASNTAIAFNGVLGGLLISFAIGVGTTFAPPTNGLRLADAALVMFVVMGATLAGAVRFISDKSSWATELFGYEHAQGHFQRGLQALARSPPDERAEIILAMGIEALTENEAWLRAHRERPLEPIVGG